MKYSAPTYVPIEITGKCNLHCKHCYGGFPKEYKGELSTKEIKDIIDQLYDWGVFRIEIGGGEPTVRKDFIEIVEYALKLKGIDLSIVTNGINWTEEQIIELSQFSHESLSIHISMDGYDKYSYEFLRNDSNGFEKAIKTTKLMLAHSIDVRWNFAIGKHTYGFLDKTIKLASYIGVKMIRLMVLYNTGRASESSLGFNFTEFQSFMVDYIENLRNIKDVNISLALTQPFEYFVPLMEKGYSFEEIKAKVPNALTCLQDNTFRRQTNLACVGARMLGAINPIGDFFFCCMLTSIPEFAGNTLFENSLETIWDENELFRWMRSLTLEDLHTNCCTCKYKELCGGGCRARAYYATGDFLGPDPLCPFVTEQHKDTVPKPNVRIKHNPDVTSRSLALNQNKNSFQIQFENCSFRVRKEEFGASVYNTIGAYFNLNQDGYYIFYLLNKGYNIEEISKRISKKYNISELHATAKVRHFLDNVLSFK